MFFRVLLIKREGNVSWTAICLEHNISAQAATLEEAQREFERIFGIQLLHAAARGMSLADLPQAPELYWNIFEKVTSGKEFDAPYEGKGYAVAYETRPVHVDASARRNRTSTAGSDESAASPLQSDRPPLLFKELSVATG